MGKSNNFKALKIVFTTLLIVIVNIFLISSWYFYEGYIFQLTLPEHAKNLPWDIKKGSEIYNQRIQSEYQDGINANVLTSTLIQNGYQVSLVASQEKDDNTPYCSPTWWKISEPRKNGERITSRMDSHRQICPKTQKIQASYTEGMSLSELNHQLEKNSFEMKMSATYRKDRFPCGIKWNISWNEYNDKKAQNIIGKFSYNCL